MNLHMPDAPPSSVADLRLSALPRFVRDDGEVVVAEAATQVPFAIERMFTLAAGVGAKRGQHAHRLCSQFMLCVHGTVDVICDDGHERRTFTRARGNEALLVPPMIWNTVAFREAGSVLVVLCDRHYEEHDYVRDYEQFVAMRGHSQV
jgi:dTDP-4-dehydrorhamnose 3,5-epimerase-like enzyme